MTTLELIDAALAYTDNTDVLDSDNALRRTRILRYAQETMDHVWNARLWPFAYTTGQVTITAGSNSGDLPADYHQVTKHGGVFRNFDSVMLHELPEHLMHEYRASVGNNAVGLMEYYSLFGYNSTTVTRLIQTPTVSGDTVLDVYYHRIPPTLFDDSEIPNALFDVPVEYHNTVLLTGTVAKLRKSKGDSRDFVNDFSQGLSFMIANERPMQRSVQRMSKSIVGQW